MSPTPTQTPTPAATALRQAQDPEANYLIWSEDFEGDLAWAGHSGFNGSGVEHYAEDANSYWEIVPDPAGSDRGKVMRAIAKGPPPRIEATGNGDVHRAYPDIFDWDYGWVEGPVSVEFDVWLSTQNIRVEHLPKATNPWLNLASIFSENTAGETEWAASVSASYDQKHQGFRLKTLSHRAFSDEQDPFVRGTDSPLIPEQTWVRLRLDVTRDEEIRLYLKSAKDGKFYLISEAALGDNIQVGIKGAHWGLYGGRDFRGIVLNDNLCIRVRQ